MMSDTVRVGRIIQLLIVVFTSRDNRIVKTTSNMESSIVFYLRDCQSL